MAVPPDWQTHPSGHPELGHREEGRTIALHSLAVLPACQGRGLGRTLLKSYMQRMHAAGIADRIALLTYERLTSWYESLGFENKGKSQAKYGGVEWNDMVYEFKKESSPGSI